ncbi:hypothetical protein PGTUg99_016164 [Puccinia graminis f. sp. tritici]|uniref:Uncharacterized protein n=1 Tax=Puccinia graminis f. sp. tritici TaxID=56615 RepID=A0A5B0LMU4_PUCGR|nr:hypothetical protein PGTUg99_016164 [Puccinia graminis f. sp. tritici]
MQMISKVILGLFLLQATILASPASSNQHGEIISNQVRAKDPHKGDPIPDPNDPMKKGYPGPQCVETECLKNFPHANHCCTKPPRN